MGALDLLNGLLEKIKLVEQTPVAIQVDATKLEELKTKIEETTTGIKTSFSETGTASSESLNSINEVTFVKFQDIIRALKEFGIGQFDALATEAQTNLDKLNQVSMQGLADEVNTLTVTAGEQFSTLSTKIADELAKINSMTLNGLKASIEASFRAVADAAVAQLQRIQTEMNALDGREVTVIVKIVEQKG